jgi:predicted restriction endonuclease
MILTDEIIGIIDNLKVNKQQGLYSVYKPILLLLILKDIENQKENQFIYQHMDNRLTAAMEKYGWQTKNKKQSAYPFLFLASSVIWEINITKDKLKHPKAPTTQEMSGAIGKLNQKIYNFLKENPEELKKIRDFIELKYFGRRRILIS